MLRRFDTAMGNSRLNILTLPSMIAPNIYMERIRWFNEISALPSHDHGGMGFIPLERKASAALLASVAAFVDYNKKAENSLYSSLTANAVFKSNIQNALKLFRLRTA